MAFNLRADLKTPYENLMTLFKERVKNVNVRKNLESEVAKQNGKLVQQLQELLRPIAKRAGIGFHMMIQDNKVEISTEMTRSGRHGPVKTRFCVDVADITSLLYSEENMNNNLKYIETQMRFYAKLKTNKKISFTPSSHVIVSINTLNRYF